MKFIGFWSYPPTKDGAQMAVDTWKHSLERRKKMPEKYPKTIFGPFQYNGKTEGFTVFEVDNADQLTYLATDYLDNLEWEFVPIIENEKAAEIFLKNK